MLKNMAAAAKTGFHRQRKNYHGIDHSSDALMQQARIAGQDTGVRRYANLAAAKGGRIAGAATNFGAEHPYMATAIGLAGLGTAGYMMLSGGNSTDATDSQQAGGVTPGAIRNPNVYTPTDIDAQLKQRTIKRLTDQSNLNQLYIQTLNQIPVS